MNPCDFSPCRRYRYTLRHDFALPNGTKPIAWCALNPSTADERQLDPTLRRIRGFSEAWGYSSFVMLNAFAFRSTNPEEMKREADPVGPENDLHLGIWAAYCGIVVCSWGAHGGHLQRDVAVMRILRSTGARLVCLGKTAAGHPRHPLYISAQHPAMPFP